GQRRSPRAAPGFPKSACRLRQRLMVSRSHGDLAGRGPQGCRLARIAQQASSGHGSIDLAACEHLLRQVRRHRSKNGEVREPWYVETVTTTDLLIESARLRRRSERTIASAMVGGVVFDEGDGDAQRLPVSLEISTRSLTAN